jgi:hypothetical protein
VGVAIGRWNVECEATGHLSNSEYLDVNVAGTNVLHDFTMHPVTAHLRGTARDNLNQVVPFVELLAHDYQGTSSRAVTDAAGEFDLPVYGGGGMNTKLWSLQVNQGGDSASFIATNMEFNITDGNDVTGINYSVYQVTARLRGTVRDENDLPVTNVNIFATSQPGSVLTGASTENDGSFEVPAFGGTWRFGLSNDAGPGIIIGQDNLSVTTTDGVDVDNLVYRVRHTNGSISGTLKNSQGDGLSGITIHGTSTISGATFYTSSTTAGAGGGYNLPVFSATWSVSADSSQLTAQGYQPLNPQDVFVNGGNVTFNFTVTAGGGGTTFTGWQSSSFTLAEQANPVISGPSGDPDGDGVPNLMEYALSLEPKSPDSTGLPAPGATGISGPTPHLTLTFRRLKNATGLAYNVQEATSLAGPWTVVTAGYEFVSSDATTETMLAKTPITPGVEKFMRLQVVQQ